MNRTRSCKERLQAFANGKISKIPELDEELLDPECSDEGRRELDNNNWWHSSFASIV